MYIYIYIYICRTKKCAFNNLKNIAHYHYNGFEEYIYIYIYIYIYNVLFILSILF